MLSGAMPRVSSEPNATWLPTAPAKVVAPSAVTESDCAPGVVASTVPVNVTSGAVPVREAASTSTLVANRIAGASRVTPVSPRTAL